MRSIIFGGGCFWGIQAFFDKIPGVKETSVGYMHGNGDNPTYEEVCASSGHVEVVKINYDNSIVSLETLLDYFYGVIDPFSLNKQGNDKGIQYRSGIYFEDKKDGDVIKLFIESKQKGSDKKIVIETLEARDYFKAEEYHQKYLEKNPGGYCHINLVNELAKIGLEKK